MLTSTLLMSTWALVAMMYAYSWRSSKMSTCLTDPILTLLELSTV